MDYVYRNNTYLVEAGIEERVPQNELFDWISRGVPVHNTTLDQLLSIEEYAEFTFALLKNGRLINKSLKSIVFQAARYNNIKLIKLLLKEGFKKEPLNHNVGLTALNWTLLNYNRDIKSQLEMLLVKEVQLSSEQKELLITVKQ